MASISEIIAQEDRLEACIWLHREGIFWKAYQYSAYRVICRQRKLKLKKKWIKIASCDVISLGFPDVTLTRIFEDKEINRLNEKLIRISDTEIDLDAYKDWFVSVPMMKKQTDVSLPHHTEDVQGGLNKILREIKEFRLEESTPIDCVSFLVSIRKELTNHGNL